MTTTTTITDNVPDALADAASDVAGSVQRTASQAADVVHEQLDGAQDLQQRWVASCRASVREHPLSAVGLALLTGMLLSRIAR